MLQIVEQNTVLNIFGHYVRANSLLIGLAEFTLLSLACYLINVGVFGIDSEDVTERTILSLDLLLWDHIF